tara:strand:- start:498 stop:608 length:111 start_codon:yes stop_codon:yes gene_type:complete
MELTKVAKCFKAFLEEKLPKSRGGPMANKVFKFPQI